MKLSVGATSRNTTNITVPPIAQHKPRVVAPVDKSAMKKFVNKHRKLLERLAKEGNPS